LSDLTFLAEVHAPQTAAFFDGNTGVWHSRADLAASIHQFQESLPFRQKAFGLLFPFNDAISLTAYLGTVAAGHAVATLNPELDPALKRELIARYEPDFIIGPILAGLTNKSDTPWIDEANYREHAQLGPEFALWISRTPHRHPIHPDLTLLISTSGSTGSPRLVRLAFRNMIANARQINTALNNSGRDCAMITTPIFNGYGQSVIHTNLLAGGRFALTRDRLVSQDFWSVVRAAGCTSIGGTPYFYQVLDRLDLESLNVPQLKKFVQTGGRFPEDQVRKLHPILTKRGAALHLMYGQAEAVARISGLPPEFLPDAARSIGFALSGGRLSIENDGHPCESGEQGELIYEGPNVMMGYATTPEDLARPDQLNGRLETGDLGHVDSRGLFYITGRKARFVKLFGWRVSLDDVEEMIGSADRPVAATGYQDRVLVFHEGTASGLNERLDSVAGRLNLHPAAFELRAVAAIPRLPNGKTDYRTLALQQNAAAG
jgi:acyl-CoA synthetase (AMP-forming)/AMP-acid ligase II